MLKADNICHKFGRCKKYKKLIISIVTIFSIMCVACTAFAADNTAASVLGQAGLGSPMGKFFNFMVKISLPTAALGLAICGFSFFISSDKGREKLKANVKNIGIAIAGIMLIPTIISFAVNHVGNTEWKEDSFENRSVILDSAIKDGQVADMSDGPSKDVDVDSSPNPKD